MEQSEREEKQYLHTKSVCETRESQKQSTLHNFASYFSSRLITCTQVCFPYWFIRAKKNHKPAGENGKKSFPSSWCFCKSNNLLTFLCVNVKRVEKNLDATKSKLAINWLERWPLSRKMTASEKSQKFSENQLRWIRRRTCIWELNMLENWNPQIFSLPNKNCYNSTHILHA